MHGHISNYHLILYTVTDPVFVGLHNQRRTRIYRPVTGGNHRNLKRLQLLEVSRNRTAERHHNLSKVSLSCLINLGFILHKNRTGGLMRTKEITTEQNLVFFQICTHCLRPVHPWGNDKLECLVTQRQSLSFGYFNELLLIHVQMFQQQTFALGIGHNLGVRIHHQYIHNTAGMVLFGMMTDDIIELVNPGPNQMADQILDFRRIYGINKGCFFGAFNQVGIIAGSVRQRNQFVK